MTHLLEVYMCVCVCVCLSVCLHDNLKSFADICFLRMRLRWMEKSQMSLLLRSQVKESSRSLCKVTSYSIVGSEIWLIDRLIDWLIDWLIDRWNNVVCLMCIFADWQRLLPRQLWCETQDAVKVVCKYFADTRAGATAAVHVGGRGHGPRH